MSATSEWVKQCGVDVGCVMCAVNEQQNALLKIEIAHGAELADELVRERGQYWRTAEKYKQWFRLTAFAFCGWVFIQAVVTVVSR